MTAVLKKPGLKAPFMVAVDRTVLEPFDVGTQLVRLVHGRHARLKGGGVHSGLGGGHLLLEVLGPRLTVLLNVSVELVGALLQAQPLRHGRRWRRLP